MDKVDQFINFMEEYHNIKLHWYQKEVIRYLYLNKDFYREKVECSHDI